MCVKGLKERNDEKIFSRVDFRYGSIGLFVRSLLFPMDKSRTSKGESYSDFLFLSMTKGWRMLSTLTAVNGFLPITLSYLIRNQEDDRNPAKGKKFTSQVRRVGKIVFVHAMHAGTCNKSFETGSKKSLVTTTSSTVQNFALIMALFVAECVQNTNKSCGAMRICGSPLAT